MGSQEHRQASPECGGEANGYLENHNWPCLQWGGGGVGKEGAGPGQCSGWAIGGLGGNEG